MPERPRLDELKQALTNDQLLFHYQPKISLLTGCIDGAEALIRWQTPQGGLRLPGSFIPLAEKTGFITEFTRRMFPRLLADLRLARDIDPELTFSFNVSAQDFRDDTFTREFLNAAHDGLFDPKALQLELTESSLLEPDGGVAENLQRISDAGVDLFMDDFATGFSSIDSLSRWPFAGVKLDQGLVRRLPDSQKCAIIVNSSIHMAHQLGLEVVAEGVETEEIYRGLLHAGCHQAQGFWMGRPMPLEDFLNLLGGCPRWVGVPSGLLHMAQLDHIRWRKELVESVAALAFGNRDHASKETRFPELDPHRCMLGRWYDGPGQDFAGYGTYDSLGLAHDALHRLGHELRDAALAGRDRHTLADLMRRLSLMSGEVIHLLQELETEAILHHEAGGQARVGWHRNPACGVSLAPESADIDSASGG